MLTVIIVNYLQKISLIVAFFISEAKYVIIYKTKKKAI